jgi:glycosyltransferase involved in cell wall biosynthesis
VSRLKVALVTTPPSVRSGIGDYTLHLLPYLCEFVDVDVFVERIGEGDRDPERWGAEVTVREAQELDPRKYDQVLYQLGNELSHAFMVRMIRAIGGTVMQHDWVLFDVASVAYPGIARGGLKGHALVLREGGPDQLRTYLQNWADRRAQRTQPTLKVDASGHAGSLLYGWHGVEDNGRWIADYASLRVPAKGVAEVEIALHGDAQRSVSIRQGPQVLAEGAPGTFKVIPTGQDEPLIEIETAGVRAFKEQKKHGDARRLAAFVEGVSWRDDDGRHDLDLSVAPAVEVPNISLARDRFKLPLNRSVVRFADAFLVHSQYVKRSILEERNATTPVGVVHHGSERRWRDEDRRVARRALGLDEAWTEGFLVTSFGGVQAHKRIDRALDALAEARRERDDIRMVLAGRVDGGDFDPRAYARRLGIEDAVYFAGFVSDEDAWEWLHASDVALNLRGPTSGGTSGGIFRAFSVGRTVIASDAAEQSELPDSCVLKVPLGEGEVDALARQMVDLRDDPDLRDRLERAVRHFVGEECHWGLVAARYAECLERFPKPKTTARNLIKLRLTLGN